MEDLTNSGSPVKLSKCSLETKANSQDLLIHDDIEIEEFELDFAKKKMSTNLTIADIKSVFVGQLITVKAR